MKTWYYIKRDIKLSSESLLAKAKKVLLHLIYTWKKNSN